MTDKEHVMKALDDAFEAAVQHLYSVMQLGLIVDGDEAINKFHSGLAMHLQARKLAYEAVGRHFGRG